MKAIYLFILFSLYSSISAGLVLSRPIKQGLPNCRCFGPNQLAMQLLLKLVHIAALNQRKELGL